MTARKPVDPRLEIPVAQPSRRPAAGSLDEAAAPGSTDKRRRHSNVEMESGPVDRKERGNPLPEAP